MGEIAADRARLDLPRTAQRGSQEIARAEEFERRAPRQRGFLQHDSLDDEEVEDVAAS